MAISKLDSYNLCQGKQIIPLQWYVPRVGSIMMFTIFEHKHYLFCFLIILYSSTINSVYKLSWCLALKWFTHLGEQSLMLHSMGWRSGWIFPLQRDLSTSVPLSCRHFSFGNFRPLFPHGAEHGKRPPIIHLYSKNIRCEFIAIVQNKWNPFEHFPEQINHLCTALEIFNVH